MSGSDDFNHGHVVEGLDRCHTLMIMIDELLVGHPAIAKANCEAELTLAYNIVMDIYQKIGALDD